jgi:uncharacterized protein YukE
MRPAEQVFRPDPAALARASDADRVVSGASGQLNYLSHVSVSLGLPDPVQEYFGPIVGRWRDLHEQAEQWRRAAATVEELAEQVTAPLGRLDAGWHGRVADSFQEHMRQVGQAGTSAADAMGTMAEVLDTTAEAMHQLVSDTVDLLSGGADRVSMAMLMPLGGENRASTHIAEVRQYGRRMLESVHELLEALAAVLAGFDDTQPFAQVTMAATFPAQNWSFQPELPAVPQAPVPPVEPEVPAASAAAGMGGGFGGGGGGGFGGAGAAPAGVPVPPEPAMRTYAMEPGTVGAGSGAGQAAGAAGPVAGAAAAQRAGGLGAGMGMMPMMGAGAGQGGDNERSAKSNLSVDPTEIFGEPSKTAPPVIGED